MRQSFLCRCSSDMHVFTPDAFFHVTRLVALFSRKDQSAPAAATLMLMSSDSQSAKRVLTESPLPIISTRAWALVVGGGGRRREPYLVGKEGRRREPFSVGCKRKRRGGVRLV